MSLGLILYPAAAGSFPLAAVGPEPSLTITAKHEMP